MPFGVTNGVAGFQRTLDTIIESEELEGVFAYVDNVTICGNDQEEHDKNLNRFLEAASKYSMTFNDDKSAISSSSITLFGYIVEKGVIKPDPTRLRSLLELPAPGSPAEQRRIVGMFAYYSKWIIHFSAKIRPLSQNNMYPLPTDVKRAFDILKNDIKEATICAIDPDIPFVVETDASDHSIAATLNQAGRPVAFFSRTLDKSESNHHPVEKEAYAIVESLRAWKHFLIGRNFKVVTDQRSVAFMYDNKRKGKIKNDKISRWRIRLQQ